MAERHRDLDRLLTFVDAVVAIAITLLVLPLAEAGSEIGEGTAADLLRAHSDDLLGFALSFVVIARLWLGQHRIVSGVVRQTSALTWLLLAWSFTIVFLPFPTSLVATTDHDPGAKILYVGTMAISSLILAVIAWVIRHDYSVRDTDEHRTSGSRRASPSGSWWRSRSCWRSRTPATGRCWCSPWSIPSPGWCSGPWPGREIATRRGETRTHRPSDSRSSTMSSTDVPSSTTWAGVGAARPASRPVM